MATNLPVAKAVVDEAEKLSRCGDAGDHDSPASRHAGIGGRYRRSTVIAGNGLDGGPAHEVAALFCDVAASDLDVRFAVCWREPGPRAKVPSTVEPGDVTDLGDEDP